MANSGDVITRCIGNIGKWQLRTILIIFLCKIPTSWFMAVIIYTAPTPAPGEYWCRPPGGFEPVSPSDWIKAAHPLVKGRPDMCHVYQDVMAVPDSYEQYLEPAGRNQSNWDRRIVVPCDDFVFRSDFHSLIAEFNLICSRSLLLNFSQCFHIFGLLLGGIAAFHLLKRLSPRRIMLLGMLAQIGCGLAAGLVSSYVLHVIFRCLTAMCCAFMYTSGQMIFADITNGRAKTITSVVFELFWSIALVMLPALSIFFTTWSQMYIAISMPTVVLVILYRMIPDSPRWFIRQGNVEMAKEIVLEGARVNKITVPENLDRLLQAHVVAVQSEPPQAKWSELFDGNPRKRHLFCVYYAWAMYILLFNSMVLNIKAYGPEYIQMNTIVMAFSEMFGLFIGMYLILYTRRRWLWTGLFSICAGVLAYLTWFIPQNLKLHHVVALEMIPSIFIKIASSTSLSILTTCTVDLVSAEKKKTLMFTSAIWARGWFLWAPFIGNARVYGPTVPLWIFATLAVIGGILTSIINHSHHRNHKKQTTGENVIKKPPQGMQQVAIIEMDVMGSIKMGDKRID